MPAPLGNQFWKKRSKHGRDKLFATPELLWEAATQYFKWIDSHPFDKYDAIRSGDNAGKIIVIPTQRPYTITGLCLYLNCNLKFFDDFEKSLKANPHEDFSLIITRIREIIYTNKFEGAAVGCFNPNIIARDLGLADKQESRQIDKNGNDVSLFTGISTDKLKKIEQILSDDQEAESE